MRLITTLLMTFMICACGQKGPLFMPDENGPAQTAQTNYAEPSTENDVQLRETSDAPNKAQFEAQFSPQASSSNP